jgi:hypothetical protein
MNDLTAVDTKNVRVRIFLSAAVVFVLSLLYFAVPWQLGDMLAELTGSQEENASDVAELSARWAPKDPLPRLLLAATAEDPEAGLSHIEDAVRRAPSDYRWRVELARAYEQAGEKEKAEAQFLMATRLAPSYASVRWNLGNFYLRQERLDDAVAQLKLAAAQNQTYREQVFSLAWDYFGKDPSQVEQFAGESGEGRSHLAYFLAARGQAADALRVWNKLSDSEKSTQVAVARAVAQGFMGKRLFPQALEFSRQIGNDQDAVPEKVTNGSFEHPLLGDGGSNFDWVITRNDPKVEAVRDARVKHDGSRSMRLAFRNVVKPTVLELLQTVVVEPGHKYLLKFWVRTENLKSAGPPFVQIVNAVDDTAIARSEPFLDGTNEWREVIIPFTTPENCSGINIRTVRLDCGVECPLIGTIWYDDFELSRVL